MRITGCGCRAVEHAIPSFTKEKPINLAHAIKLSKIANILTAILHRLTSYADTIQTLLNYARGFEKDFAVSFVHERFLDIVYDLMSSNGLPGNSRAAYARYICVDMMMITRVFCLHF